MPEFNAATIQTLIPLDVQKAILNFKLYFLCYCSSVAIIEGVAFNQIITVYICMHYSLEISIENGGCLQ